MAFIQFSQDQYPVNQFGEETNFSSDINISSQKTAQMVMEENDQKIEELYPQVEDKPSDAYEPVHKGQDYNQDLHLQPNMVKLHTTQIENVFKYVPMEQENQSIVPNPPLRRSGEERKSKRSKRQGQNQKQNRSNVQGNDINFLKHTQSQGLNSRNMDEEQPRREYPRRNLQESFKGGSFVWRELNDALSQYSRNIKKELSPKKNNRNKALNRQLKSTISNGITQYNRSHSNGQQE